jgi:hypothetical protein
MLDGMSAEGSGMDALDEDLRRQASLSPIQDAYEQLRQTDQVTVWAAENRGLVGVPDDAKLVEEASSVTEIHRTSSLVEGQTEIVVKVAWEQEEDSPQKLVDAGWPRTRFVRFGSTLAFSTGGQPFLQVASRDTPELRQQRDDMLQSLVDRGRLSLNNRAGGADMHADVSDGPLRVGGIGRMLHID